MPFIQRVVEPIYLSRQISHEEEIAPVVTEHELEAVTNNTLSNALRQLASLVVIANDIFDDLAKQLQDVSERATKLRTRTDLVEEKVSAFDPKTVTVPEGDLCDFSARTTHFAARRDAPQALFSAETRPAAVRRLYESAARTPVPLMRQLDRHREDGRRCSRFFLCTPVLGQRRRRHARLRSADIDIETRTPAAVAALRRWTSAEALGDVTVLPDCSVRLPPASDADADETDHRLPSPEEQLATVALRFPGHMVAVDVSGRAFQRMSLVRRSQQLGPGAGREAPAGAALRPAASSDLLSPRPSTSASSTPEGDSGSGTGKKLSHLRSLKQWAGRAKLRLTRRDSTPTPTPAAAPAPTPDAAPAAPAPPPMPTQPSGSQPHTDHAVNVYESVGSHLPIAASSGPLSVAVKLREKRDQAPPLHSSSGNWSASSESGRASLGSSTSTSHQPRSTTTVSSATGAGHALNTSASSSGTLTPDLAASIADQDSSSVYSCDTEGYYTSFHLDSGLKPLREEDPVAVAAAAAAAAGCPPLAPPGVALGPTGTLLPQQALHSTCALSTGGSPNRTLTADSEYELFGKGSTSTTTSSAGTVCTTLQLSEGSPATGPAVPERKSSLLVAADVHADSPDSGHNTSSSPAQSASPPGTLTVRSRSRSSDCDFSESDLEAVERVERIRVKTAINSSRIPSMCVITPPQSDDEAGTGASAPSSPPMQQRAPQTTAVAGRRPAYEKQLSSDSESDWAAIVRKERRPHLNLNGVIGKVKDAFTGKKSPESQPAPAHTPAPTTTTATAQQDAGDYVTIADVRPHTNYKPSSPRLYSNTAVVAACRPTEYVSLNELPPPETTRSGAPLAASPPPGDSLERRRRQGARVTLDSEGRVVYSSDSLRRRGKTGHTTFEPGPYVKEPSAAGSPMMGHRTAATTGHPPPTSPQLGKVIIRAATPATCVSAQRPLSPPPVQQQQQQQQQQQPQQQQRPGAYVNVQSPTRSAPDNRDTEEGKVPPLPSDPKLPPFLRHADPALYDRISGSAPGSSRVKRSDSYRLANSPILLPARKVNRDILLNSTFEAGTRKEQAGNGRLPSSREQSTTLEMTPHKSQQHEFSRARQQVARVQDSPTLSSGRSSPADVDVRQVSNPNLLGRRFYGAQVRVDPELLSGARAAGKRSVVPVPADTERAKVLSNKGNDHDTEIWACGAGVGKWPNKTKERRNPTYGKEPPRYGYSPHAVWSNTTDHTQHVPYSAPPYWTLPARRSQDKLDMESSGKQINPMQQDPGSRRFNTIATSSCRNYVDSQRSNEHKNMMPYQYNVCATQLYSNIHRVPVATTNTHSACGMPASVPKVPETMPQNSHLALSNQQRQQTENTRQAFFSSTPTKSGTMSMDMSTNFSPIPKQSLQNDNGNTFKAYSNTHLQVNHVRVGSPRLISPPRTSMTSEEIFAAIHKSKKRLNIKTDSDSYSRSASPSCSSATSLSPGSSESSLCGLQGRAANRYTPETGTFNNRNENGRNRHSWSPNASEEEVLHQSLNSRSPVQLPGSRQSWACDRLASIQQTSRNDFKRLLLQQSSKSNISSITGYPGTKLSAVEQLRLSRQKMVSATINTNGCYSSRSPVEKRNGGPKLLSSPRTLATWKFSSPRTDVLSSTIPEDCAEDEDTSNSPQNSPSRQQQSKLASTATSSHGTTLMNPSVRRPLSDSFGTDRLTQPSNVEANKTGTSRYQTSIQQKSNLPGQSVLNTNAKNSTASNRLLFCNSKVPPVRSPEMFSKQNIKENVNSNQINNVRTYTNNQIKTDNHNRMLNTEFKSPQLIMQQQSLLNVCTPKRQSNDKTKTNYYNGSPGRYILGTLESKSPSPTLETAL
ncbi:mucin-19-like [Schistocerca americana]|uniref:mucin-19-like n=1 Tax=Schistocerca americana TaxID=7009 RepID=UPI001F4FE324|nr:mucin-19-like [Schistocerca americana]